MKMRTLILLLISFLGTAGLVLRAADTGMPSPGPEVVVLTGENVGGALPVETREYDDSLGGVYVTPSQQYLPLAKASLPIEGERFQVWVHYRNLALQMKTRLEGKTKEFSWNWKRSPESFIWRRVGVFQRSELGAEIWFINDPKFNEQSGIDAIVITSDPNWKPAGHPEPVGVVKPQQGAGPDEDSATIKMVDPSSPEFDQDGEAVITIDWGAAQGPVSSMVYGINAFHQFDPEWAGRPEIALAHNYMEPKLVRIHNGGLVRTWYDDETEAWDREKIERALSSMPWRGPGVATLININSWPKSFDVDEDRRLDLNRYEDYATLCAELVEIVNVELDLDIEYWEVTNEKDFPYWRKPAPGLDPAPKELAKIYSLAASAMREVDSSIKIGGPAACNPDPAEPLVEFAVAAQEELDFLSFHSYASGALNESDELIYAKVKQMAENTALLIRMVEEAIPGKRFEYHLNEHNINYSWRKREMRMSNEKGAVFDALSLIEFAKVPGLTAANAWTDVDFVYGKFDNQGAVRPGAHVYRYFNRLLAGDRVAVEDESDAVESFATIDSERGRRAFVLVNRKNGVQSVTFDFLTKSEAGPEVWSCVRIDESGVFESAGVKLSSPVLLPPHSVTFYWHGF